MNFRAMSEQEIEESAIWKSGTYDFTIQDAKEKKSRNGNPMIELKIEITRDGKKRLLLDWLLAQRPAKLRHAAIACGLHEKYMHGVLSGDDFVGKTGRLKLGVQRETSQFPRRNVVIDYEVAPKNGLRYVPR